MFFSVYLTEGTSCPSYVATVYEHQVILNPEPHVPLSRAGIIVFPEDGIHGFNFSRLSISGYLETIPDPLTEDWNPCTQPDRHNHTEVYTCTHTFTYHHPCLIRTMFQYGCK
uniref:Uncharacterized protein n=1 Tax=Oncorhynchus mykiss TaxID=8022 RepID=A0A8K9X5Z1_ONCMY